MAQLLLSVLSGVDVPCIGSHELRDSAGALLLGGAVQHKVVDDMLGHSRASTTVGL
jgi:integrase